MPVYIVLKGNLERYWNGLMSSEQNIGWMEWSRVDWMGDTPQTVMTTRAPAVLKVSFYRCITIFNFRCYFQQLLLTESI